MHGYKTCYLDLKKFNTNSPTLYRSMWLNGMETGAIYSKTGNFVQMYNRYTLHKIATDCGICDEKHTL